MRGCFADLRADAHVCVFRPAINAFQSHAEFC
jgi:hypothetical protein